MEIKKIIIELEGREIILTMAEARELKEILEFFVPKKMKNFTCSVPGTYPDAS